MVNEDAIKHLEFIQSVISRMASNSFLLKGWTVTLVAALFALAAQNSNADFIYLAVFPIISFWILDAYYLRQERFYRALYNDIRKKEESIIDPFTMDTHPFEVKEKCYIQVMFSKTLGIFYLTIFITVAIMLYAIEFKPWRFKSTDDYIKSKIEKQIEDPRSRIKVLNYLRGLIPLDKRAEIEFKNINGDSHHAFSLNDAVFRGRVIRFLNEEKRKYEVEVSGVICRIRDDDPPSFSVLDWSGNIVKVEMPDDKRLQILNYLADKVPIRLVGIGNKRKGIEDLDEIEPYAKITINSLEDISLKSPIVADLSYEKSEELPDYWVVGNDEFGIYGVDDTVDKAIEMFKSDLHDDYIAYKAIPNDQLSDMALSLKKKLITIFEG